MRAYPKLITAPAEEPVSVAWLTDHLRFDIGDEDPLVEGYIKAARSYYEKKGSTAFITQMQEESLHCWWDNPLQLYLWPIQLLDSVTYIKDGETTPTDITSLFEVDTYNDPAVLRLKEDQDFPSDLKYGLNVIKVRYVAGYGDDEEDVPEGIRHAIRLRASTFFADRIDKGINVVVFEQQADILFHPFMRLGV